MPSALTHCLGVRVRSSEEGFSSPAHRCLEESSGGCWRSYLTTWPEAGRKTLSQHTQSCLRDIRELLIRNTPRKIEASQAEVIHIYVDASFDYSDYSGRGGMLVNMSAKVVSVFNVKVDTVTLDEIMHKGQKIPSFKNWKWWPCLRPWKSGRSWSKLVE